MVILGAGFWGFPHFHDKKGRAGLSSKAMAVTGAPGDEEDLQRPIHRIHRSGFGSGGDQVRLNPPCDVAGLGDEHVEKSWWTIVHLDINLVEDLFS